FSNIEISGGAGKMAQKLMAHVKAACDYSMPRARAHNRHHSPVYWWNDEIANARRQCNYARRKVQRSRGRPTFQGWQSTFRESRRALKVAINQSKRRCFLQLCDSVDHDPWGKAYQLVIKRL
ncbi:hypothetical protein KR044_011726, partial [Drosophila immigrans]